MLVTQIMYIVSVYRLMDEYNWLSHYHSRLMLLQSVLCIFHSFSYTLYICIITVYVIKFGTVYENPGLLVIGTFYLPKRELR